MRRMTQYPPARGKPGTVRGRPPDGLRGKRNDRGIHKQYKNAFFRQSSNQNEGKETL